jgi:3-hydroxymyristoyl/3-hydroxydecanoyl-(acyl carrier protein) dehydratase
MPPVLVLPETTALERAGDRLNLRLVIPPTNPYFDGHFAGVPVLPGVVQVGCAIELARLHLSVAARFSSLAAVKFMRVIQPDAEVTLSLAVGAERRELAFEYRLSGTPCSSGRVLFH